MKLTKFLPYFINLKTTELFFGKTLIIFGMLLILIVGCKNEQKDNNSENNSNINQCYNGIDQTGNKENILGIKEYSELGIRDDGYMINYYAETGQISSEGMRINGMRNGIWIEYYKNGNIKSIISYWENKENGVKKIFYENGQIQFEGYKFSTGAPFRKIEWDEEDGSGTEYLIYPKIFEHGTWNEYNKDGTLILSTEYNMGEIISETVSTPVEDISH